MHLSKQRDAMARPGISNKNGGRESNNRSLLAITALFGVATAVIAVPSMLSFPQAADGMAGGFTTPILAFEFARSETDVAFLAGGSPAAASLRDQMDAGHWWDTAFPFCYGGFLASLVALLLPVDSFFFWPLLFSALVVVPADLQENAALIEITELLRRGESGAEVFEPLFSSLHVATWCKFGALGVAMTGVGVAQWLKGASYSGLVGVAAGASVFACFVSGSNPLLVELMVPAISVFLLAFFGLVLRDLFRG